MVDDTWGVRRGSPQRGSGAGLCDGGWWGPGPLYPFLVVDMGVCTGVSVVVGNPVVPGFECTSRAKMWTGPVWLSPGIFSVGSPPGISNLFK